MEGVLSLSIMWIMAYLMNMENCFPMPVQDFKITDLFFRRFLLKGYI